jgi:hypothetical protein
MPRFDAELVPFGGGEEEDSTDFLSSDRGMAAAFNRMSLFRPCTRKFWAEEFEEAKEEQRRLAAQENESVTEKIKGKIHRVDPKFAS